MGNISYTAHVSNKKSAITSKSKLAAVAKHNLRKYKSSDYSKDNICIIYGTSNLIDDVKTVYHKEFDEALEEYNKKQTRPDRKIEDYFEHVAGKEQDMAVEIIIQIGDREFWKQFDDIDFNFRKVGVFLPETSTRYCKSSSVISTKRFLVIGSHNLYDALYPFILLSDIVGKCSSDQRLYISANVIFDVSRSNGDLLYSARATIASFLVA